MPGVGLSVRISCVYRVLLLLPCAASSLAEQGMPLYPRQTTDHPPKCNDRRHMVTNGESHNGCTGAPACALAPSIAPPPESCLCMQASLSMQT
eukprot:33870-Prymnesium_polylepis.1